MCFFLPEKGGILLRVFDRSLLYLMMGITAALGQVPEEDEFLKKETIKPKVIDFSKILEKEKMTREDFEVWKRERELRLRERLTEVAALERAVDPEKYIVGPSDIFSFNVWGAMEAQYPLEVGPEGKLAIPSVGDILVDGMSLSTVQETILSEDQPFYANSKVTLTLEALRFFRIHVVGEVEYPGVYIARAVDRIPELIAEAGGVTEWAWKQHVELRHPDGSVDFFNLDQFETQGALQDEYLVNGGDVIFVPPLQLTSRLVYVEGDQEVSGTYQILPDESVLSFLQRIRALRRNTHLFAIRVTRRKEAGEDDSFMPFARKDEDPESFSLRDGDRITLPSNYVYVKGAVRISGAYPYILNMRARDYAGMAGGDFRSGPIKRIRVYHSQSGKVENGPNVLVEPGDVVHLHPSWNQRIGNYLQLIPMFTSLILAAQAAGLFGN